MSVQPTVDRKVNVCGCRSWHFFALFGCGLLIAGVAPRSAEAEGSQANPADLRTFTQEDNDGSLLSALRAGLRGEPVKEQRALVDQLLAIAADEDATLTGRGAACRLLVGFADESAVGPLAPLLVDESLSHEARRVLESIPGKGVDAALLDALEETSGNVRLGIIDSLSVRRASRAVAPLTRIAQGSDGASAEAAIRALGAIGDPRALKALTGLQVPDTLARAWSEAKLTACANLVRDHKNLRDVLAVLDPLSSIDQPMAVRTAAIRLTLEAEPKERVKKIGDLLVSEEPEMRELGAHALGLLESDEDRAALVDRAGDFPADSVARLIRDLAAQGSKAVLPLGRDSVQSTDAGVRLAAIEAVAHLGDKQDVTALLKLAEGEGEVADAALSGLATIPDPMATSLLFKEFGRTDSPLRQKLTDVLVQRSPSQAVRTLFSASPSGDADLDDAIYRAIGMGGDPSVVPDLLKRWDAAPEAERAPIDRAIVAIGRRWQDGKTSIVLGKRLASEETDARETCIRLLGAIGDEQALQLLEPLVATKTADAGAIRAVISWRTPDAVPVLRKIVEQDAIDQSQRLSAWQSMYRLARYTYYRDHKEGARLFNICMWSALRREDKLQLVDAAEHLEGEEAMGMLRDWLMLGGVAKEAEAALNRMAEREAGK